MNETWSGAAVVGRRRMASMDRLEWRIRSSSLPPAIASRRVVEPDLLEQCRTQMCKNPAVGEIWIWSAFRQRCVHSKRRRLSRHHLLNWIWSGAYRDAPSADRRGRLAHRCRCVGLGGSECLEDRRESRRLSPTDIRRTTGRSLLPLSTEHRRTVSLCTPPTVPPRPSAQSCHIATHTHRLRFRVNRLLFHGYVRLPQETFRIVAATFLQTRTAGCHDWTNTVRHAA